MATNPDNTVRKYNGFGTMGSHAVDKLHSDNDVKILVVGANSQTGIGKTTFAIELARFLDQTTEPWDAREKAFIEIDEYIQAHLDYAKGSCLLLDEIEAGADSRRATSHDNVNLSQAWQTMRARNIATIATSPSMSTVDNRMLELADYWVLVRRRGIAQPFEIRVNDFNGKVQRKPINTNKDGVGEHVTFPDLPDGDRDKEYLDEIKDNMLRGLTEQSKKVPYPEHREKIEKAVETGLREKRNQMMVQVYKSEEIDSSMSALGNLPAVNLTQPSVSDIINGWDETETEHV
jgi:hypothetical protein